LATFYLILNLNMEMKREDMNQNWGYFYPNFFDFLYYLVTIILEIWVLIVNFIFYIYISSLWMISLKKKWLNNYIPTIKNINIYVNESIF
jgi:hypothetical protein